LQRTDCHTNQLSKLFAAFASLDEILNLPNSFGCELDPPGVAGSCELVCIRSEVIKTCWFIAVALTSDTLRRNMMTATLLGDVAAAFNAAAIAAQDPETKRPETRRLSHFCDC
jgi:hypothetical protein